MRRMFAFSLFVALLATGHAAVAQGEGRAVAQLRAQGTTASAMLRLYLGPRVVWEFNLRRVQDMTTAALVCEDGSLAVLLADLAALPVNVNGRLSGTFEPSGGMCGSRGFVEAVAAGGLRAEVAQDAGPTIVGRVRPMSGG